MKRMLPYRDRQWTCQWFWEEKDSNWGPKILGKMTKPCLITLLWRSIRQHSRSVSNLLCGPSGLPPSPHLHTYRAEIYVHTANSEREEGAVTILSLYCGWIARIVWEGRRRKVCVCVLSWWEGQCMTGDTVYYLWKASLVTLVPSHICVWSIIVVEASDGQRQGLNLDITTWHL